MSTLANSLSTSLSDTLQFLSAPASTRAEIELKDSQILVEGILLKATPKSDNPNDSWKFAGIASDENPDVDGDEILKKSLDLTYAQKRGYVNWDHSRAPKDQLGFLTKALLLSGKEAMQLAETEMKVPIPDTASIYVEGELYPYVEQSQEVQKILKSTPEGRAFGLGLSLDGVMARDKATDDIVRAFVRGVAITPVPAQVKTLCKLKKSLRDYSTRENGSTIEELRQQISKEPAEQILQLAKAAGEQGLMNFDSATLWILKQRPSWTYDLASKLVRFTISQKTKE